jgi:hypothetical protein
MRQQEIVIKSESNTKSCVLRLISGTTDRENAASIGPSCAREKFFSQSPGVGFYALARDRKMTENRDFRAGRAKNGAQAGWGTERGKIAGLWNESL